jgi:HlyD family secretion protein
MKSIITIALVASTLFFTACNTNDHPFDASGSFEAEETIISAEASGVLKEFNLEEGQELTKGQKIGYIDSTQLYLKKLQVLAQAEALVSRKPNVSVQIAALEEQLENAQSEQQRIAKLVKSDAATTKQLDDINSNIEVLKKQIQAQRSSLNIANDGIGKDAAQINVQVQQVDDQLAKCRIVSPMNGTVLSKYAEQNEMTMPGKALYKVADLSNMMLRAYVSGDQLSKVQLNQKVTVSIDNGEGGFKETEGIITWIKSKAEFTPKTIQTKNERANMVYAMKIKVVNDGSYKIGMYGEIKF